MSCCAKGGLRSRAQQGAAWQGRRSRPLAGLLLSPGLRCVLLAERTWSSVYGTFISQLNDIRISAATGKEGRWPFMAAWHASHRPAPALLPQLRQP